MGSVSSIEWTDSSWNPVRARYKDRASRTMNGERIGWHCQKVSPGCQNCYAERVNRRLGIGGTAASFTPASLEKLELFLDEKTLTAPLRWRKPRRIFLGSMTDVFGEFVPDEWIDRIFAVMALAPQHTFQVLTKRAKRMREWFERTASGADRETIVYESKPGFSEKGGRIYWPGWPLPNVWLGISAERQQEYDLRIGDLLRTRAAIRFLSLEPLLGPIDMRLGGMSMSEYAPHRPLPSHDWVIVGGESGPGARPMDVAWARDIVRQCREAGVKCFVKQLGGCIQGDFRYFPNAGPPGLGALPMTSDMRGCHLKHPKGGDPSEWPADIRVREFPEVRR